MALSWYFFTATDPVTEDLAHAAVISAPDAKTALTAARKMGAKLTNRNRVAPMPEETFAYVPPQWTNRLLTPDEVAWTALWNDAEREAFEQRYAASSLMTVEELHAWDRYGEPCDCLEEDCASWRMGYQHEDALFEDDVHPAWAIA